MKKILSMGVIMMLLLMFTVFTDFTGAAELNKAMVMISADDGYPSVYTNVYPILIQKYGLPFTAYIPANYIGDGDHVNLPQVREMNWNGVEIGNHANHSDFTGMSYSKTLAEIKNAQAKLKKYGLTNVTSFAYPFGVKTNNVVRALKAIGLTSGRGAWDENDQFNYPNTFDQWWIETLSFRSFTKTSNFVQLKPYIDDAVANKAALSIALHDVFPGAAGDYQLDSAELEKTAAYLNELRAAGLVNVVTVTMGANKLLYYKNLP
jgi:peptidoglycan/xylan/chitin deacetylase (PgdA/CDA1 family)